MKKLVIAAAVLGAFAGTAQAQSSVTLFGVVDTGLTHVSSNGVVEGVNPVTGGPLTGTVTKTFQSDSGINSDRIGFRGTEDLGGGLKAGFWLEAGFSPESGAGSTTSTNNQGTSTGGGGLTFNRRSTVSLIGNWGEVRLGRDYSTSFWNAANVDPFGYNGIGEIASLLVFTGQGAMGETGVRVSNSFAYLTPNTLGGFFVQAQVALGQNAHPTNVPGLIAGTTVNGNDNGNYYGVNLGYQNGPIYAGLATAYTSQTMSDVSAAELVAGDVGLGAIHTTNFGISYDFGFIKPDLFYQTSTSQGAQGLYTNPTTLAVSGVGGTFTTKVTSVGAVVPAGQGEFRFNFAHASGSQWFSGNSANMFAVGYVYNLSKRTAMYAEVARVNNSGNLFDFNLNGYGGDNPGGSTSGVTLGLRTSF